MNQALQTLSQEVLLEIISMQTEIARIGQDLGAVMAFVAEQSQRLTRATGAVMELAEGEDMVYRAAAGRAQSQLGLRVKRQGSLAGLCVEQGAILRCDDSELDPRVDREACRKVGLRSMIVVPLRHADHTVGVIKVLSPQPNSFHEADEQVLRLTSDLVAAAMYHATNAARNDLYHRATHDTLTGLANRALFYDRLRQSLTVAQRYREQLAVLNLDMDGLKPINDTFGHRAGDAALGEIARRISSACRQSDTVARLGGDEFAVILRKVDSRAAVHDYCERLAEQIGATKLRFDTHELALSASIGFSLFPEDGDELDSLIDKADQAMYEVKRGRGSARLVNSPA